MGCARGCMCAPALCLLRASASLSPATGIHGGNLRSLSASSTRTQGAATAPTRGPKTPPEQILGDNRAPTWDALQLPKPLPEP